MLHEFVAQNREEIIQRCRVKVAARPVPPPTPAELTYGIPRFLDQLVEMLKDPQGSTSEMDLSAAHHGRQLRLQGFTVSQVVHDYGDVCQSITDLAMEKDAPISVDDFRTLNRCLDDAIASAVTEYGRERHRAMRDIAAAQEDQRFGFLAHEVRNLVHTASMAFEMLRTGNVGAGGSTGAVLKRSLSGSDRPHRSLGRRSPPSPQYPGSRRLRRRRPDRRVVPFSRDGGRPPVAFSSPCDIGRGRAVDARRPPDRVRRRGEPAAERLQVHATAHRRGPHGQRQQSTACRSRWPTSAAASPTAISTTSSARSSSAAPIAPGSGLGLAFSRWGAEVNDGRISARNLPDHGCVFTIELPRVLGLHEAHIH